MQCSAQSAARLQTDRSFSDLYTAWPVILASAFIALVVALCYTWLMQKCAGVLVWGCVGLTIIAGFFLGYSLLKQAQAHSELDFSGNRKKALNVMMKSKTALPVLTAGSQSRRVWAPRRLCAPSSSSALSSQCKSKSGHTVSAALASIERATCRLAIIVVQESSEVIEEIKTLVVFPLLPVLLTIGDCCANLAVLTPRCCCAKVTWRSGSGWLSTSTRLAILLLNRRPKGSRKQTDVSALSAAVSNRRSIFRRPQRES